MYRSLTPSGRQRARAASFPRLSQSGNICRSRLTSQSRDTDCRKREEPPTEAFILAFFLRAFLGLTSTDRSSMCARARARVFLPFLFLPPKTPRGMVLGYHPDEFPQMPNHRRRPPARLTTENGTRTRAADLVIRPVCLRTADEYLVIPLWALPGLDGPLWPWRVPSRRYISWVSTNAETPKKAVLVKRR